MGDVLGLVVAVRTDRHRDDELSCMIACVYVCVYQVGDVLGLVVAARTDRHHNDELSCMIVCVCVKWTTSLDWWLLCAHMLGPSSWQLQ